MIQTILRFVSISQSLFWEQANFGRRSGHTVCCSISALTLCNSVRRTWLPHSLKSDCKPPSLFNGRRGRVMDLHRLILHVPVAPMARQKCDVQLKPTSAPFSPKRDVPDIFNLRTVCCACLVYEFPAKFTVSPTRFPIHAFKLFLEFAKETISRGMMVTMTP